MNKITELQIQILINNILYKKNIIDEYTYRKINNKLLRMIDSGENI